MNSIKIVLADLDEKYLSWIEYKFIEMLNYQLDLETITDKEYLDEYFNSPKELDILVINESLYNENLKKHKIKNVFILTEEPDEIDDETGEIDLHMLYKYSNVAKIYNDVKNKSILEEDDKKRVSNIITVYSASGGVGKTTIAMGVAGALKNSNKRVIYVNTEILQNFNFIINKNEFNSSPQFEKMLIDKDERIINYFTEVKGDCIFDYLLPFRQAISGLNIGLEELMFFIEKLKESNLYDYIVVDTSSEFTIQKSLLMGKSDKVILVTTQSMWDAQKLNSIRENIDCSGEKFIFICNKYTEEKKNYLVDDAYLKGINIDEKIGLFDENNMNVEVLSKDRAFTKLVYMFI